MIRSMENVSVRTTLTGRDVMSVPEVTMVTHNVWVSNTNVLIDNSDTTVGECLYKVYKDYITV